MSLEEEIAKLYYDMSQQSQCVSHSHRAAEWVRKIYLCLIETTLSFFLLVLYLKSLAK